VLGARLGSHLDLIIPSKAAQIGSGPVFTNSLTSRLSKKLFNTTLGNVVRGINSIQRIKGDGIS
jgi:hypothetical protein